MAAHAVAIAIDLARSYGTRLRRTPRALLRPSRGWGILVIGSGEKTMIRSIGTSGCGRIVFCVTSAVGSEFVVTGPFEARVRVGGEQVRGCLADMSLALLRGCEPVRSPGAYQRQRHMPGRWFSTTTGGFLEYESLLERDWMLLMDFDREVEWICEQPLRLRYVRDGRPASHVPDLLVWRQGAPELCDVKSQERVDDLMFRAQVEATGLACAGAGIGYRVLSEPEQQLLANVRWLAGFRERPADPDGERARILTALAAGSCTVAELVSGAREPMLARPVLMHLLWASDALVDLSTPIGEDSVVWARLRVVA
ncbi:MAG: TnsA-like heteromeric transposase endonuclease subunit [Solirubrobacteraceae bacterium]